MLLIGAGTWRPSSNPHLNPITRARTRTANPTPTPTPNQVYTWYNLLPLCYFRTLAGKWQRKLLAPPCSLPRANSNP